MYAINSTGAVPGAKVSECEHEEGQKEEHGDDPAMPHTVHVNLRRRNKVQYIIT